MTSKDIEKDIGKKIYQLAKKLWPINRSITGNGLRKTLKLLSEVFPKIKIHEIKSGKKVFDWVVPKEWNVSEAWVKNSKDEKIIDFKKNNLHLLGYSEPINKKVNLKELNKHLHSIEKQPDAIPYVTSYYKKRWGFCLTHNERKKIDPGIYHVFNNAKFTNGALTYGEIILKGESKKEIFISTNICHPSLANNELSGPVVAIYLAKWLASLKKRKFTYRLIFVPETIGSISYLSKNYKKMKKNIIAGFVLSCVGDQRNYSYLPSKMGNTLSDEIAQHVLKWTDKNYKTYDWSQRGSDERQYCSPGIDLPIASIFRTKYGEFSEYHTSLDNLGNVVTPDGLSGSYLLMKRVLEALEYNCLPKIKVLGEPFLSKLNLYPSLSKKNSADNVRKMMNLITYADGKLDLIKIANKIDVPVWSLYSELILLNKKNLLALNKYT